MTPAQGSPAQARSVCDALGIPLDVQDLTDLFRREVLEPVAAAYAAGRTPNPCVLCNPAVKLTALASRADELGFDAIATGHYARITGTPAGPALCAGADSEKDQSYFLARVPAALLGRLELPLGEGTKTGTRSRARAAALAVADVAESQETCFSGDGALGDFLEGPCGLEPRPGPVVLEDGTEVGRHPGLHRFTVGQRRGLGIPWPHPLYVVSIEPERDRLVVGPSASLEAEGVVAGSPVWGVEGAPAAGLRLDVRVRYRSSPAPCCVERADEQGFCVRFERSVAAIAPGQAAVLYSGERVVGAGWIEGVP